MVDRLSTVETVSSSNPVSFFRIFTKNLVLIILITVFSVLCGVLYSILNVKPTYTASRSVILRTAVDVEDDSKKSATSATNNATLAKIYLPDVEVAMKSPNVIARANENYINEQDAMDKVRSGAVSVRYGENSLIFTVSYTDLDEEIAKSKLDALIKAASYKLPELIEATDVSLINVQNDADISVKSSFNKYIIFGFAIGVILSFGLVMIKYALDNTVKNKNEYEYLTGVNVIAVIDKVDN